MRHKCLPGQEEKKPRGTSEICVIHLLLPTKPQQDTLRKMDLPVTYFKELGMYKSALTRNHHHQMHDIQAFLVKVTTLKLSEHKKEVYNCSSDDKKHKLHMGICMYSYMILSIYQRSIRYFLGPQPRCN